MITPILETEKILLRPLKVSDAEVIYKNWTTDPDVAQFMRWSVHESVDETIAWLTKVEANISSEKVYEWGFVLKETNELFGSGGIYYNDDFNMFELGYNIMKRYWGLGLTTEASKAIIDFAVKELKETQFLGRYVKGNDASRRVLEKLGFVYQKNGKSESFDGKRKFENRENILTVNVNS